MPNDPQMRASDQDRDRVAAMLREHHAAGRLTVDEFQERLDGTYAAKTLGELDGLQADLPGIDLYRLPEATMRQPQQPQGPALAAQHGRLSPAWRAAWGSWSSVSMVLFAIWLITVLSSGGHSLNGLWFLWVAGPWGALLLGRWMFGGHPSGNPPRGVAGPGASIGPPGGQLQDPDEHTQRQQEHIRRQQEHMQRRQEQIRRHDERMRRRRDY
jgi:Domain of unknown function (DUF1707)